MSDTLRMARGWESKEVESQIEAAESRTARRLSDALTAEQARQERERESVQLSRIRVLQDLESAVNPKYIEMLQRSLDFLDQKLAALDRANKPNRRE